MKIVIALSAALALGLGSMPANALPSAATSSGSAASSISRRVCT